MKKRILILFIVFGFFLSGSYYEEKIEKQLEISEKSGFLEKIPDEALELLEKAGIEEFGYKEITNLSFKNVSKIILESVKDKIYEPFNVILTTLAAALVCSLINAFTENFTFTGKVLDSVSVVSVSALILIPIKNLIESSAAVINECSDFMIGFVPVYSSAIISSGYASSAMGFRSLMLGFSAVVSKISVEIIIPLILIYFSLCIAGSVSEINISEFSKSFKNISVWILGILTTLFSGIMGLGTLITSSSDSIFSKTAKFLIGSSVPIVGSTVSEALSSLKGCFVLTKNILGTYAVIIIAAIFLPSIIKLVFWKICLGISSEIGNYFGNKNLHILMSSACTVTGIVLAILIITAILFIFSVSIMLMIGGG